MRRLPQSIGKSLIGNHRVPGQSIRGNRSRHERRLLRCVKGSRAKWTLESDVERSTRAGANTNSMIAPPLELQHLSTTFLAVEA
jgi:hypothetical protein